MNHLAHALLSGAEDDVLVGSLLGDFWRGAPDPGWSPGVRAGVLLHRRIDVYTDSHPVVAGARGLFEAPWRRYAGILIDIYFDHALARDWQRHAPQSLDEFSAQIGGLLERHRDWLPPGLNRFAGYFRAHGLFAAYAQRQEIDQVLVGISHRLRHPNRLGEAGPALWTHAGELDAAFEEFFPDLLRYARDLRESGAIR
jgi:acyl carrier protein phosphodiesterase